MLSNTLLDRFFDSKLRLHLVLYAGLVITLLFLFPSNGSFSSDDGAYAGQVFALQNGAWALDRPLTDIAEINEGWINSYISSEGPLPYVRHPVYIYVSLASSSVFGDTYGLGVPAVIGSILCVFAAWILATEYNRRSAPAAFWIVGLGPLLVNSTTFWAHTLAAGLTGIGVWAIVRALRNQDLGSPHFWVLTGVVGLANAGAILLRTESVLWFAGLAASVVLLDRSKKTMAMVGAAMMPTVGAFIGDRWWSQSILNRYEIVNLSSPEEASWLSSRVPAGFHLLLSPSDGTGALFVVLGMCLIAYGAVKFRFRPESRLATALLLTGGALFATPTVLNPSTVSGLLAAWPILIAAGIIGSKFATSTGGPPLSLLYLPVSLLTVAVLITQYAGGGGLEWGARYLSPAFVGLGVLAALNLHFLAQRAPLVLLTLTACPAILGTGVTYRYHVQNADFVSTAAVHEPDVIIANQPAGTRIAWSTLPTAWYTADDKGVQPLLFQLAEAKTERIAIFGFGQPDLISPEGYELIEISDQLVHLVAK